MEDVSHKRNKKADKAKRNKDLNGKYNSKRIREIEKNLTKLKENK